MSSKRLVYRSYGKVNLYLDVLNRRSDGYTNIETIFQSVGVADTLHFTLAEEGLTCSCDDPTVPTDDSNLVIRAAQLLQRNADAKLGVHIAIEKHIPVAGGMAGGSSNAAVTLVALNELWGLGLSEEDLGRHAIELGSDVPFCLRGGTVAATGRGEIFHALPALPETWLLLLTPGVPISAAAMYHHPYLERSLESPLGEHTPAFNRALNALRDGDFARVVFNRLETPAFHEYPDLLLLKERLIDGGCIAAAMSGSGSTLFGVSESKQEAEALAQEDFHCPLLVVPTVPMGIERVSSDDPSGNP